jgi:hypothetical protein
VDPQPAAKKKVGALLAIGILLLPFVFAWGLLRRGYSGLARGLSFGWMVVVLAVAIAGQQSRGPASPVVDVQGASNLRQAENVMFVSATETEEKNAPNGTTVNRIYRGQRLEVSETRGEWVRVTKDGFDPRWVRTADLSKEQPAELAQPKLADGLSDPRLGAIPKVGEYGHNEADVVALRTAAMELLTSGQCNKIDDASKSVNVAGVYYLNCGEASNRFFRMQGGKPSFCGGSASSC